jgi:hypothetical protein
VLNPHARWRWVPLVVALSVAACAQASRSVVTPQAAAQARALGRRLAHEAREEEERRRRLFAGIVDLRVVAWRHDGDAVRVTVAARNRTPHALRSVVAAMEIFDASGTRIAVGELRIAAHVRGASVRLVSLRIPYVRFGEDAGAVAAARAMRWSLEPERAVLDGGLVVGGEDDAD